jgi:beta-galactosidase/beta-glucuronidase
VVEDLSQVHGAAAEPDGADQAQVDDRHHPRPQLRRRHWRDLCGIWEFAFDDDEVGVTAGWQHRQDGFEQRIRVPFPFESAASGIADPGYHQAIWYRRSVEATVQPGHRLLLHFGAVDYRAHVWVNGQAVAYHEGGHTPFTADITSALREDGRQVIVVRAEDQPQDLHQPRGKQDWQPEPHAIWYDRTSGIWQPVWLEEVPETRVRSLRWTPDVDDRSVRLLARLRTDGSSDLRLRVVLRRGLEILADDTYTVDHTEVRRSIALPNGDLSVGPSSLLWSPEHPNLIDATIMLLAGEEVLDQVESYTALRSICSSRDRLLLNNRPYYLRLVLAQNFWPESHLAAPDADALRREVQLVKDLGFNGVRLHQKVEDPRFLAWCDRLGVLVWAEMPSAYEFSPTAVQRITQEWLEVLERDASHPCVIAWVPINESWGVPALERSAAQQNFVRGLYHLTKAVDPDRLVIGNDGWEQPVTDIVTIHDYTSDAEVMRARYGTRAAIEETLLHTQPGYRLVLLPGASREGAPVMVTEFGGISLDLSGSNSWRGYGSVRTPHELLARYRVLVDALLDSPAIVGFCWTQLTDTQQERNGLVGSDRRPKVTAAQIRTITKRVSAAVAGDAVNEFAYGDYAPAVPVVPVDPTELQ